MTNGQTPALTTLGETRPYIWAVLVENNSGRSRDRYALAIHLTERDAHRDAIEVLRDLIREGDDEKPHWLEDDLATYPDCDLEHVLTEHQAWVENFSAVTATVMKAVAEKEPMITALKAFVTGLRDYLADR